MSKLLLDRHSGWTEYLHHDEAEDKYHIEMVADVESVLEWCKQSRNEGNGHSKTGEFEHVARIPMVVIEIWKKAHGVDPLAKGNEDLLERMLKDPALSGFRTGGLL